MGETKRKEEDNERIILKREKIAAWITPSANQLALEPRMESTHVILEPWNGEKRSSTFVGHVSQCDVLTDQHVVRASTVVIMNELILSTYLEVCE